MGKFSALVWQSAVTAEAFVSNFLCNQNNKPFWVWLLELPWVEVPIFKQLTLETQCMFALSGSCKIIKVISAYYELITCKKAWMRTLMQTEFLWLYYIKLENRRLHTGTAE